MPDLVPLVRFPPGQSPALSGAVAALMCAALGAVQVINGVVTAVRPDGDVIGALLRPEQVLRVRLVSTPGEGRCWTVVPDALTRYVPPDTTLW